MKKIFGVIMCVALFAGLPARAQDCAGWETEGANYWKAITLEKIQTCINNGADVNVASWKNKTPLHLASWHNKNANIIKALLDAGADVDTTFVIVGWTVVSRTALHQAAKYNENPEVINLLVQAGADVNLDDYPKNSTTNLSGATPLHLAAQYNKNPEVIIALLNAGAEVNARLGISRHTPLHLAAAYNQNSEVIVILLNAGANAKIKNKNRLTAFDLAKNNGAVKKNSAYQALEDASK